MLKHTFRSAAIALFISLAAVPAFSQTVLYPIPEQQKAPETEQDYPIFVNRMIADGNYTKALQYADEGLAKNKRNVALMFKRATILEHLGRRDEAMAAYQQLINAYPEIPEPYNNLAILTADGGKGDIDHAIELLDRAITANPNFATAHENLGDLYALKALQNYRLGMPANTPANRDARRRVSEKIAMLQIATGNDPDPDLLKQPGAEKIPAFQEKPAAKADPIESKRSAAAAAVLKNRAAKSTAAAKAASNAVTTTTGGITETVQKIAAPAAAAPAQTSAPQPGSYSAKENGTGSTTKSTLFKPLPELN